MVGQFHTDVSQQEIYCKIRPEGKVHRFIFTACFEDLVAEVLKHCSNNAPNAGILVYQ
jgi:hypothetical protein